MTSTSTSTFTIANARYVTSRIKTDLKLLQREYGQPTDDKIEDFGEEAAQLLSSGYLGTVSYGFKREGAWVVARHYTARDGSLAGDDRAGHIPRGVDTSGATFASFLTYSPKKSQIDAAAWETFEKSLPVQRTGGTEPSTGAGYWQEDRSYSSNGSGVTRKVLRQP